MTNDQKYALVLLFQYTYESCDPYRLMGNENRHVRRDILSLLTGEKERIAECGVNRLWTELYDLLQPEGRSMADMRDSLRNKVTDIVINTNTRGLK